jgi:diketogulonate reductase-like aldo/keto reductase
MDGQDLSQPIPYNPSDSVTQQITSSFHTSLRNLHTTYLDSYILHSPLRTMELTLEAWKTLIDLQDKGKIHMIGVSNTYDVKSLETLSAVRKVQIVQNRWYQGNDWDKEVVKYCTGNGIQYQLSSVQAICSNVTQRYSCRSFWTLTGSPILLVDRSLRALAETAGCTPQQAVYRVAQMLGITPLCGSTNEAHMLEAVGVDMIRLGDGKDLKNVMETVNSSVN